MPYLVTQNPHIRPFTRTMCSAPTMFPAKHVNLRQFEPPDLKASSRNVKGSSIKCMANPRRVKMVAKQIRRELSDILFTDKVLQYADLPETALDERGKEVAISGLKSKAKYVRSELGKRMKLRLTPEIRFIEDESLERGSRAIAILDRIKDESEKGNANSRGDNDHESPDQSDDDGD